MPAVLPSWRDGPEKRAIVDFVTSATEPGPGRRAMTELTSRR